jgi:hypothetical protein
MPQEKIYPTERVGSFCWSEAGSEKVCEKGAKSLFTKLFAIVYVQAVFLHLKKNASLIHCHDNESQTSQSPRCFGENHV